MALITCTGISKIYFSFLFFSPSVKSFVSCETERAHRERRPQRRAKEIISKGKRTNHEEDRRQR